MVDPSVNVLKRSVTRRVDSLRPGLRALALKIHANPELGYKEVKASAWLTAYLEKKGFTVERGICQLPTAFRATYGDGEPRIAVLAEYDALAGVGHACGHNLICTIALGAATAVKPVIDRLGGAVAVIGTPAEETYGGKVLMAKRGAFDGFDAALIVHPNGADMATSNALAMQNLSIEFFGKASHASAGPDRGINALDAMVLSFNAIGALRQHIRSSARIHGIITDGGKAANVIPDHSAGEFMVRAADNAYLEELKDKVINCFAAAAKATGARLEYRWDELQYAAMKSNMALAHLYIENARLVGREPVLPRPAGSPGSTDMGNVSQVAPAIHPMISIGARAAIHSPEFAEATAAEPAVQAMVDGAKIIGCMIVDLISSPALLKQVRDEFGQASSDRPMAASRR